MHCINCGVVIPEWAHYCPRCGTPVPPHQGFYPAQEQTGVSLPDHTIGSQHQNDSQRVTMKQNVKQDPPLSPYAVASLDLAIAGFFHFPLLFGFAGFAVGLYAFDNIMKGKNSGGVCAFFGMQQYS